MARLFDISQDFEKLFDWFETIIEYEFPLNDEGQPVDDDGNVVNPEKEKAEMLKAWFDTLSGIKEEFEFKAENIAQYIKCLKAEAENIDTEIKKLKARQDSRLRRIDILKKYLINCMDTTGITKIDRPRAKITIRKNAPSLKIDNELDFIYHLQDCDRDDLLKYSLPEIRKNDVKNLIKNGVKIKGAYLESSRSVIIG